jgi:hypothetical protein
MKYPILALSLALLAPVPARASSPPPIRLKLSDPTLMIGQGEKLTVRTADDGYLLVLRTDTQGHVRVVFPVNPTDDDGILAGRSVELRGRGDRDAFSAFEEPGTGMVLAAVSDHPFNFVRFETNGHWTRAGLVADSSAADPASAMLGVVDAMSTGPYKYDVAGYTVQDHTYRPVYDGWYDHWWDSWYGPWNTGWYSPWYGTGPLLVPGYPYPYPYAYTPGTVRRQEPWESRRGDRDGRR